VREKPKKMEMREEKEEKRTASGGRILGQRGEKIAPGRGNVTMGDRGREGLKTSATIVIGEN